MDKYTDFKKTAMVRRNATAVLMAGGMTKEAALGANLKALLNAMRESFRYAKDTNRPIKNLLGWLKKDIGKYGPAIAKDPITIGTGAGLAAGGTAAAVGAGLKNDKKASYSQFKQASPVGFSMPKGLGDALKPAPAPIKIDKPEQAAGNAMMDQAAAAEGVSTNSTDPVSALTTSLDKITAVAKGMMPKEQAPAADPAAAPVQPNPAQVAQQQNQTVPQPGVAKAASLNKKAQGLELLLALLGAGLIPGAVGAGVGALSNKRKGLSTREGAIKGFGTGAGMGIGGAAGGTAGAYTHPVAALLGLVGGGYGGAVAGNRLAGKIIEDGKK